MSPNTMSVHSKVCRYVYIQAHTHTHMHIHASFELLGLAPYIPAICSIPLLVR